MSEAEALSDWWSGVEYQNVSDSFIENIDDEETAWWDLEEHKKFAQEKARRSMRNRYEAAKATKVGSFIRCAYCGKRIKKTTYHKAFCSNGKTRKGGNCKAFSTKSSKRSLKMVNHDTCLHHPQRKAIQ